MKVVGRTKVENEKILNQSWSSTLSEDGPVWCHVGVLGRRGALHLLPKHMCSLLLALPPRIQVGLASVGNDAVKCANHGVS